MATITRLPGYFDKSFNNQRRVFQYTGPTSYVTGGDPVTAETLGLKQIDCIGPLVAYDSTNAVVRLVAFDPVGLVFRWFVPNTGSEVAAATNLSTYNVYVEAIGR